jgi:rubrerythrin
MSIPSGASTLKGILTQAIKAEEAAYALYTSAAKVIKSAEAKIVFGELAKDEAGHKEKIEKLMAGNLQWEIKKAEQARIADFHVGDGLVTKPLTAESDLQDALLLAIKREKGSHEFYAAMAGAVSDAAVKGLFELLAKEELKHKNKVEAMYEGLILKDN